MGLKFTKSFAKVKKKSNKKLSDSKSKISDISVEESKDKKAIPKTL